MKEYPVSLLSKKLIAEDMYELHVTKPTDFSYDAGQFVQFLIPGDEKHVPRSYSISSAPSDEALAFCIERIDGGLGSTYLTDMNEGDTVMMRGPRGRFVVNKDAESHMYIATGSGLAPIMAMLRDELETKKSTVPTTLLFGVRHEENIFWQDRLDELAAQYSNFSYQLCLSQPKDIASCNAVEGRVTAHLPESFNGIQVYLCGNSAMVMEVRSLVIERGADAKQLHFEIF